MTPEVRPNWIRLRQIALVAHDLGAVTADLQAVLGLGAPYPDPGVATFGLQNGVFPAGHQFVEVVAPIRENTTGGRYLERRNGDGGYMVILQCDDHAPVKARVDAAHVRKVLEHDTDHYKIMQLHPRDTGGSFLEIDVQVGGEPMDGPWEPAGPRWQENRTTQVLAITGAEIQGDDPDALAAKWSSVIGIPVVAGASGAPSIELENATLRFVPVVDGRGEGLGGIDLRVSSVADVTAAAAERSLLGDDGGIRICGMRIAVHGRPA